MKHIRHHAWSAGFVIYLLAEPIVTRCVTEIRGAMRSQQHVR